MAHVRHESRQSTVVGVRTLSKIWSENFDWTPQLEFLEEYAWQAMHGESPRVILDLLESGYTILGLMSFLVCLHVTLGISLSAMENAATEFAA